MERNKKLTYLSPHIEVVDNGNNADIITASATLGFDGNPNYDSGAWT